MKNRWHIDRAWGRGTLGLLAGLTLALSGCRTTPTPAHNAPPGLRVTLDGDISEWPPDAAAYADEHNLYLRFTVPDERFTLQSADQSVVVSLDLDASTSTGFVGELVPYNQMGTDLEIRFSPEAADGRRLRGVVMEAVDATGARTPLDMGAWDLQFAPTYAAGWYELRLSRTPSSHAGLPLEGMCSSGFVRGIVSLRTDHDKVIGFADPFVLPVDRVCPDGPRLSGVDVPAKPVSGVRVLSYNVEKSSPLRTPAVFGRVLTALNPDVILMQEWEDGDDQTVQAWLTQYVPTTPEWFVIKAKGDNAHGGGVLVASRYPMTPMFDGPVTTGFGGRPVRCVGAFVKTPQGEVAAVSVHLKCCGTKDSPEDKERMLEAKSINAAIAAACAQRPGARRVIGGDFNLVGSRPPLDLLRAGLDADGADLAIADAPNLAERIYSTWRDPATGFAPGRLDWVMYSESISRSPEAFVFDASRLNDAALARLGLDRTDCTGSDHLPLVVDLAW